MARIAADAAGKTGYHHGDKSLENTIVAMAQDFTGANNLPFSPRDGQFGTRDMGDRDAAESRYAETKPEWWIPYVFRREDLPILTIKEDEGEKVEPVCFFPIFPTVLINGCSGIATGWSTFIPNHNPLDVIRWIKSKIQGRDLPDLKPWYRGFSGSIEVVDRRANKRQRSRRGRTSLAIEEPAALKLPEESSEEEEGPVMPTLASFDDIEGGEEEGSSTSPDEGTSFMKDIMDYVRIYREETGRPLYSLITRGDFYTNDKGQIVITELPIGRWTHPYTKWLEKLRDEDKLIKEVRDLSKSNVPGFEITEFKKIPSYKSLGLKTQFGMSNMVLLDMNNRPQRYDCVNDFLEAFYEIRLDKYGERKAYILSAWARKIEKLREKRRFIQAIVDKELVIENRTRKDIHQDMDTLHFSHDLLSTSIIKFSEDEIGALDGKIEEVQTKIGTLEGTTSEQLWLRELQEFERAYRKQYKIATKGDKLRLKVKKARK